jgi:hypothetical protein
MGEALGIGISLGLPVALLFLWGRHLWQILGSVPSHETPPADARAAYEDIRRAAGARL